MIHNAIKALLLATLVSSCAIPPATATDQPQIMLTKCVLKAPGVDVQVDAKCGSLAVPEDPATPGSRLIDLNLAVVGAINRKAEPDPLFILVGGPGQSATETFAALYPTLYTIHQQRDIVLVDQRGTGKSNPLRCLDPQAEDLDDEEVIARLKECPARLAADPRLYTTDIAMQDLDRVRSALGYESINLYGVSYGTRAALVYLKMYPERVRSLILDAVVDPSFILYQEAARDGQGSLDLFFARCERDPACSSVYPGLRSEFESLLQRRMDDPVDITIPHPVNGTPLPMTVSDKTITDLVFSILYSPDLVAILPFAIHQAYVAGNYAPLITQGYLVDSGIYDGMFYSVACTEDAPLVATEEAAKGLFGNSVRHFIEVCEAWPQGEPPKIIHEAVSSDVPVLLISGEADPITPPRHAEALRKSLPNSLHLIFPGMGHGNGIGDCARRIMGAFLETASTAGLDTTCVEDVAPPPFFVDFSGPQP